MSQLVIEFPAEPSLNQPAAAPAELSGQLPAASAADAVTGLAVDSSTDSQEPGIPDTICEPRLWRANGWTAKVIKNEDDEGWAVAMIKDGESEPALVGPWTMGRDKKNPKPLDTNAFNTLVKTAFEVLRRAEQHLHATLHKSITVTAGDARITVLLDIVPDEDEPWATLSAQDEMGEQLAQVRVAPNFVLNRASASAWIENEFKRPR